MDTDEMWNDNEPVTTHGLTVPDWIDQDITPCDVASIVQGGCASGAYMPAVTYYQALETMQKHGDDVLQYIQDNVGELPKPSDDISWSGLAVFYLSYAVDLWACGAESELENVETDE